ncbi:hypothetical protein [Janibacter sp. GS2]|uniref:hypothetical protein n=1 Tax=Janibacter sp. GS2 TaxID=3442646 RepID=UPI003EB9BF91
MKTATTRPDGVTTVLAEGTEVRCQAEFTHELVTTDEGPLLTGVLKVRVPPRAARDELAIFTLDSQVTFKGSASWVLSVSPVERAGVISHTLVITGDRADRFGGAWPVALRVTPSAGRDRWGDPLPAGQPRDLAGWLKPKSTGEPVDFDQSTESTATLYIPGAESIAATDRVDVLDSPMAGRWLVDGDPHPEGSALAVPLRRP